ncbi:MAG: class I SAM-dependent methyltransferase [Ruminococcus sp.]|nr:class I SAM-dependent methyltransferase [Ruminococcus sp.]
MFWDSVSRYYDFAEFVLNRRCFTALGKAVASEIESNDVVFECACGTGAITKHIAPVCRYVVAADLSAGMLKQAEKNCRGLKNISFKKADIMSLNCPDDHFDKVVAGNVIHLLDDPEGAVRELVRVCRPGGKIIIPTYINIGHRTHEMLSKTGLEFKRSFDVDTYKEFFAGAGYENVSYFVIDGKVPCEVAVITK